MALARKYEILILIIFIMIAIYVYFFNYNNNVDPRKLNTFSLAAAMNISKCANHPVSPSSPYKDWKMTDTYTKLITEYNKYIAENVKSAIEGNTGQHLDNTRFMHYMAQTPFIKTVCETGFNLGHSSLNWLTASPQIKVYSFDLGSHDYAPIMAKKLKEMFPGRLHVTFGNSIQTVPKFIKENPNFKCDLIFVDGGHVYDAAHADVVNFISIANKPNNFILFDDHPGPYSAPYGKAWDEVVKQGKVEQLFACYYMPVRNFSLDGQEANVPCSIVGTDCIFQPACGPTILKLTFQST